MNILLHGSLGDFVLGTGLPEAIYKVYGEKTFINNKKIEFLWSDNPYICDNPCGKNYLVSTIVEFGKNMYYPVAVFKDLSNGIILNNIDVCPKIYTKFTKRKRRIVINDQAGWPSRRGYPYLGDLARDLIKENYEIVYLRNDEFRDCNGSQCHHQLYEWTNRSNSPNNLGLIHLLGESELYIGYESGIAHLASACGTNYISLQSCVDPIVSNHPNCILSLSACKEYCYSSNCEKSCFKDMKNFNDKIVTLINKFF